MKYDSSLSQIPIVVQAPKASKRLHWARRATQTGFIAILLAIPMSGLFRIDPVAGAFVILDHQIWWSDFFLVFGFWMMVSTTLVAAYSYIGTAFCGWACPQNTLAEWANRATRKWLGKRAEVSLTGEKMKVSSGKNHPLNWVVLGVMMLGVSMFFALIPLFYFYTPSQVWAFLTFRDEAGLAGSLHYIYSILVAIIFVDVAFIRHFWCRFMCVYKVWQHGFKTRQTLHIEYDASRSDECVKCNLCTTSCFLDLDPKRTDIYDTCINCGECVSACDMRQAKKGQPGLLRLVSGDGKRATLGQQAANALGNLSSRLSWTLMIGLVGLGMFSWGVWSYQDYHLAVYRADTLQGAQINDYRIAVSNKLYHPAELSISVEGLAPQQYRLSSTTADFTGAERVDLNLHVTDMPRGLHRFVVHAKAADGWQESYRVQHFVGSQR